MSKFALLEISTQTILGTFRTHILTDKLSPCIVLYQGSGVFYAWK
jgi:hypothetical protein